MTIDELLKLFPDEKREDWRELPKGGIARNTANISVGAEITDGVFWGGVFLGGE